MTSRRRKKPPDPPSASLLSLSCCNHALSSDPIQPYPCNLSPSLGLDYRGKYAAVSRPLPSRSRTEEYTVFRSSSIPSIWVTTTSAVGYRPAAVSCSSAWQRSLGCSSSGFCLMFKVRKARFLHTKMSQRLLSDRSDVLASDSRPSSQAFLRCVHYIFEARIPCEG
uniref:Uncharacterized protein n=1 Tax=Opuntia streptacantha TaxID=393608 RepID=A0A7C9E369_OPUST